ncbi:MAG: MerR family transcriptional regulator [Clostridia bacterium]|nr:MerR family transcriptional regulator [Clostridia bacterium]
MRLNIGEAAALAGVSVRTLRYYDEIGLLRPSELTETGYRVYDEAAMLRLQQILFYRELDFPLSDVRRILSAPDYDRREALIRQRTLLRARRERLDALLRLLDENLKGEKDMSFDAFTQDDAEALRARYAGEAEQRWGRT